MRLNEKQRKVGMKYNALQLLSSDIRNGRYNELQQVYESLNLRGNEKLVNKLSEERNIGSFFTHTIYMDILFVIADYMDDRWDIVELIDLLYAKRFPHIKNKFLDWERQYRDTGTIINAKKFKISFGEQKYLHFLFYKSDIFPEPDKVLADFNFEEDARYLQYSFYDTDRNVFDDIIVFGSSEDKEPILSSIFFKKYLVKRRTELADYLHIKEKELANYIHSEMKSQSIDGTAQIRTGIVGLIETFTKNIIVDQNGGSFWYNAMTSTGNSKKSYKSVSYVPDVDGLIENYFKSYVVTRYVDAVGKKTTFTKITLSRECIPSNYEIVYQTILCMYEMDVLYKMFALMQRQYYQDFSWEKITNQDLNERYNNIISDLEQTIINKENKIRELAQKNNVLLLQNSTEKSKQVTPFVAENNKLLKVIEDKDSEIENLKKRLQYQEQFIDEISKPEVEKISITYDLNLLQTKRFLFVGHIADVMSEIRHNFPNSIFMESETTNISGIEVDAIVMMIKWMSHSMFYKVKSIKQLKETKTIMCNTKNIEMIYQKMYDEIV